MLLVVVIGDCEDEWPCLKRVADTQCKTENTVCFMTCRPNRTYLRPHALAQEVVFFLYAGCSCSLFLPSGKVLLLMAVYSTERVGLIVIVQALHTNTSSVRSCLLQHLFIDCFW